MAEAMDVDPLPLPALPGFAWPVPIVVELRTPERLYEQWRRLVEE